MAIKDGQGEGKKLKIEDLHSVGLSGMLAVLPSCLDLSLRTSSKPCVAMFPSKELHPKK
jgi:hypothetical protein